MKKNLLFRTIIFSMLMIFTLPGTSYAWGTDIIVNPVEGRHYSEAKVSVAYDGTIYYGRLYSDGSASSPMQAYEVLKSSDNGVTFTQFLYNTTSDSDKYTNLEILATGINATDFKIFIAHTSLDTVSTEARLVLAVYKVSGPVWDLPIVDAYNSIRGWESISMASDYRMKSENSAPYSFSIAAVKAGSERDSIVVWTDDLGSTDLKRRAIASTPDFFRNVSIAVGTASEMNTTADGILGITWDWFVDDDADYGSINAMFLWAYDGTDFINPGPYSIGEANKVSNPVIALSQTHDDFGSASINMDLRTIILYEHLDGAIHGALTDTILEAIPDFKYDFVVAEISENATQAHMIYNPYQEDFLITYYNQTNKTLPFKTKSSVSPASQNPTTSQANYRDVTTASTVAVKPRLDINNTEGDVVFAWNDSGKSMFESENSTVSIDENSMESVSDLLLFPNPATDHVNIIFNSISEQKIQLYIYDLRGSEVYATESQVIQGENLLEINTNNLAQGQYVLMVSSANNSYPVKLIIK